MAQPFAPLPMLEPIAIARNAVPAVKGKRPLIVVSHGNWGSRFSQAWLIPALTDAGYDVKAITRTERSLAEIRASLAGHK